MPSFLIHGRWTSTIVYPPSHARSKVCTTSPTSVSFPPEAHIYSSSPLSLLWKGGLLSTLPSPKSPRTVPDNLAVAAPMGYGESKLVSEHILHQIAKFATKDMNFSILRAGQIAGPVQEQGTWNENEWFPSLLKTSKMLRKLPEKLGVFNDVDWIPVRHCARVLIDIVHSSFEFFRGKGTGEGARVYNLVNPSRVQFESLVPAIKNRLGADVEAVSFDAWIAALDELDREAEEALEKYPALKILEFFRGLQKKEAKKSVRFTTDQSVHASQTMRDLGPITVAMIEKWMEGWGL